MKSVFAIKASRFIRAGLLLWILVALPATVPSHAQNNATPATPQPPPSLPLPEPSSETTEPVSLQGWLALGWSYYNQNKLDEAIGAFETTTELYPESPEAHLALGELYLEKGKINDGRSEITKSIELNDSTALATRAHMDLAVSLREEDTARAVIHLQRALEIGGSTDQLMEISHQIRFCNLLVKMGGRSEAGPVVIHYPPDLMGQATADALVKGFEATLYLVESYVSFDVVKPIHIFLYASYPDVEVEIRDPLDEMDAKHREYHVVYSPALSGIRAFSRQVILDLQDKLNRHSGSEWVNMALPVAITGMVSTESESGVTDRFDCDAAVLSLVSSNKLVNIDYLRNETLTDMVSPEIRLAELGSFLRWVHSNYSIELFQDLLTQPNIEVILNDGMDKLQKNWLGSLQSGQSLTADTSSADLWAKDLAQSSLVEGVARPEDVLREGLTLYMAGEPATGLRKIHRAIAMDPGMGLGYYILGWIASREGRPDEAKEQLTLAIMLFNDPDQIAWCHVFLVPIYIREENWTLAKSSLDVIKSNIQSSEVLTWANGLSKKVDHLLSLVPPQALDRTGPEFESMRGFLIDWNKAANTGSGLNELIDQSMDKGRAKELILFYSSIRKKYPGVVFNHALQTVSQSLTGKGLLIEVRIQALFGKSRPGADSELVSLTETGYRRFLEVTSTDNGFKVSDWEDGTFPMTSARFLMYKIPQIGGLPQNVTTEK